MGISFSEVMGTQGFLVKTAKHEASKPIISPAFTVPVSAQERLGREIQKENKYIQATPKIDKSMPDFFRDKELYNTDLDYKDYMYSKYDYDDIPLAEHLRY